MREVAWSRRSVREELGLLVAILGVDNEGLGHLELSQIQNYL
jgi:hypothetical protein